MHQSSTLVTKFKSNNQGQKIAHAIGLKHNMKNLMQANLAQLSPHRISLLEE
jgi:hypothetical protein